MLAKMRCKRERRGSSPVFTHRGIEIRMAAPQLAGSENLSG